MWHTNYAWYYIPRFIYFGCEVSFVNKDKEIKRLMDKLDHDAA